jgi:hypothetical protein
MNEHQTRALWAATMNSIGDAIKAGLVDVPSSVSLWTQYVSLSALLHVADNACPTPLPIKVHSHFATVRVPTGELVDLDISWNTQTQLPADEAQRREYLDAIEQHNTNCCTPPDITTGMVEIPLTMEVK